jgi:hypothetical protein
MTALTLEARPGDSGRAARPLPWRRMVLVTWLQHQGALLGATVLLGVVALYLGIMGLIIHRAWDVSVNCHPITSAACVAQANSFGDHWHSGATIAFPLQLLPALVGAFVGAPLLAREMETGTFRYAWTQGFGRTRWIVAKMALIGSSLAVIAGAFGVLATWYFGPFVAEGQLIPLDPRIFDLEGIAFPGWILAAFAIGAFAGMAIRKVVPAMAATLAVVGGLGLAAGLYLRQHYLPPLILRGAGGPVQPDWTLGSWYTGPGGKVMDPILVNQACPGPGPFNTTPGSGPQCLPRHGIVQWWSYQPPSRYWPFQGIEGGALLALAVLLIAATIWVVHRKAA